MKFFKIHITYFNLAVFLLYVFMAVSCVEPAAKEKGARLTVVATTGLIADALKNISGDKVEVIALMGPGVDPHLYKATHGDVRKITEADVIFYNGLHLEGKMGSIFEKIAKTKTVIAVTKDVPSTLLRQIEGYENTFDPHIWFDVKLWEHAVRTIRTTLQEADSTNASIYEENCRNYLIKLDSLDRAVRTTLSEIPPKQRILITAHDAFGYFGDAYSMEVKGLQGISTLSEFGLRDVTELVNLIIERKVKAIFVETSVSEKSINAIIEGCRDKKWNVTIGGSLYSDALGAKGTPEGTYIGMVNSNVQTIVNSLK